MTHNCLTRFDQSEIKTIVVCSKNTRSVSLESRSLENCKEKCSSCKTLFKVDALMNALYSPSSHQYSNTIISFFPKIIQLNTLLDQAIHNQDQESLLGKHSKQFFIGNIHFLRIIENNLWSWRESLSNCAQ